MPRETMSERNNNPAYYEVIACEECGGTEGLQRHAFAKDIMCVICINVLLAEAASEDEGNEKEGYYTDMSYNELLQERNA